MTEQFASPSVDPASIGDLFGTVRLVLTKFLQGVDDMLPAKVIAYDRATNLACVQPLITMITTTNIVVQRDQLASIPVFQYGAGGFVLSFPVNTGDLGWIKANDRDISNFLKFFAQSQPNTVRKHNFSDAVFIPDNMLRGVTIASEDNANVVLQNLAGTVKVALWSNKVKVVATTVDVECTTATVNATGTATITSPIITLNASNHITMNSPLVTMNGVLTQTGGGTATFSGNITTTGEVTAMSTIPLSAHLHTGVQSGGSNTGGPIP